MISYITSVITHTLLYWAGYYVCYRWGGRQKKSLPLQSSFGCRSLNISQLCRRAGRARSDSEMIALIDELMERNR